MPEIEDLSGTAPLDGFAPQCPPGRHLMVVREVECEKKDAGIYYTVNVEAMSPEIAGSVAREGFAFYGKDGGAVAKGRFRSFLDACQLPPKGVTTEMCKGRLVLVTVVNEPFKSNTSGKMLDSAKASKFEVAPPDAMQKLFAASAPAPVAPVAGASKVDF